MYLWLYNMEYTLPEYNRVKGIHPGAILKRELKKRCLKAVALANSIDEYPQTINAISKEKRGINPKLSIKLGDYFKIDKEYFMLLQASFEVKSTIQKAYKNPLIGKIRNAIFWDTNVNNIDLIKNKRFVIQRILERGNETEIGELIKLYGKPVIREELKEINNTIGPYFSQNINNYIDHKPLDS